jgi:hypothetical protein
MKYRARLMAAHLRAEGIAAGFDLRLVQDFEVDHSIMVPLHFPTPRMSCCRWRNSGRLFHTHDGDHEQATAWRSVASILLEVAARLAFPRTFGVWDDP